MVVFFIIQKFSPTDVNALTRTWAHSETVFKQISTHTSTLTSIKFKQGERSLRPAGVALALMVLLRLALAELGVAD